MSTWGSCGTWNSGGGGGGSSSSEPILTTNTLVSSGEDTISVSSGKKIESIFAGGIYIPILTGWNTDTVTFNALDSDQDFYIHYT